MMLRVLAVEFLKIRGKLIWLLVVLGPLGVVALQAVNFGLRYDYLTELYKNDLWGGLIRNVSSLMTPTLFIGLAILASMSAGIEHQMNAWKQTLALPIAKRQVFAGKFALTALLLLCSSTLLALFAIALGLALGFGWAIPAGKLLAAAYWPYLAVMPFIALQCWLSVVMANQALPLTLGIVGMIAVMFGYQLPDWVPWKWPLLINGWNKPVYSAVEGMLLGAAVFLAGLVHFVRRDVK